MRFINLGSFSSLYSNHSGFIDFSIRIFGGSQKERKNLAQYIDRPPISLKKIALEDFHGKVLFHPREYDISDATVYTMKTKFGWILLISGYIRN